MGESDHTLLANLAGYSGRKRTPLAEALLRLAVRDAAETIARNHADGDDEKAEDIDRRLFEPQGVEPGVDTLGSSDRA